MASKRILFENIPCTYPAHLLLRVILMVTLMFICVFFGFLQPIPVFVCPMKLPAGQRDRRTSAAELSPSVRLRRFDRDPTGSGRRSALLTPRSVLATSSDAPATRSFLFLVAMPLLLLVVPGAPFVASLLLLVRHLLLEAMHLFLIASCFQ